MTLVMWGVCQKIWLCNDFLMRINAFTHFTVRSKKYRQEELTRDLYPLIPAHILLFASKVIRHNPPLPGLLVHALPVLNHDRTDHNTKLMEYRCIATVAWTVGKQNHCSTFCAPQYQGGDTHNLYHINRRGTYKKIVDCKVGLCTSLRTVAEFL